MIFLTWLTASAADDCVGGTCGRPHDEPVPETRDAPSDPPPLDRREHAHLRTATFALG